MQANLSNIQIVLVRTFHPGNIGSAARSMKTMGLNKLCLVNPKQFPDDEANKMAAGAEDLLNDAQVVQTIPEAIRECTAVIASTVRPRGYDLPELNPEQAAEMLLHSSQHAPVALLFGPERMGLHNDDIKHAKYRVTIPANPAYSSLNMAAAVQTLSYEIYKQFQQTKPLINPQKSVRDLPSSEDTERFYQHLEQTLKATQFLRPHQGETMQRLRHLFTRAEPDVLEMNILRGILRSIDKSVKKNN